MVIAFSGKLGSGKSSISIAVAHALHYARVSFGDYVRQIATDRQLTDDRQTLQDLGECLLQSDARAFCAAVLAQSSESANGLVIDGVRHEIVLRLLKELVAPKQLVHIHLSVNESERNERILTRQKPGDEKGLDILDKHPTEIEVINVLPHKADLILDSSMDSLFIVNRIATWVKKSNNSKRRCVQ